MTINVQINAITIRCGFYYGITGIMTQSLYECVVLNDYVLNGERQRIDYADGNHWKDRSNNDVKSIWFGSTSLKLFPKNLENVFQGLTLIGVQVCNLTEITKDDLKPFVNLEYLFFDNNNIKSLSFDTFLFNPKLEGIYLQNNQIEHIDPLTFSNLNKLRGLFLDGNNCTWMTNAENRTSVEQLIAKIENRGECSSNKNVTTPEEPISENFTNCQRENEQITEEFKNLTLITIQNEQNIKQLQEENQKVIAKNEELTKDNEKLQASIVTFNNRENLMEELMKIVKIMQSQMSDLKEQNKKLANKFNDFSTNNEILHEKESELKTCQLAEKQRMEKEKTSLKNELNDKNKFICKLNQILDD